MNPAVLDPADEPSHINNCGCVDCAGDFSNADSWDGSDEF